jgi:hypothetical protein
VGKFTAYVMAQRAIRHVQEGNVTIYFRLHVELNALVRIVQALRSSSATECSG